MGVQKQQNLSSQCTGTNLTFVLPEPYEPGTAQIILNRSVLEKDVDYTEQPSSNSFLFNSAPLAGATLIIFYMTRYTFMSGVAGFSVATLRESYLFGLELRDRSGKPITDPMIQTKMDIALAYFQRQFDIFVVPTVIKSTAILGNSVLPPEPIAYDLLEPPYDYDVHDYMNWGYIQLRRRPILSVERMRLIYPTGQTIINYPTDWIKLYPKFGQIQIVPMAGSFKQYPLIGQGAMYLPLLSGFLTKNVPQLINVDYTVGYAQGQIPIDLSDVVYKKAAIEIMRIAGNAVAPGISNLSTGADGLSESTTLSQNGNTTLFASYIKDYQKDIDDYINDFRETETGINFVVS